jgi:CBS domain-containing protein
MVVADVVEGSSLEGVPGRELAGLVALLRREGIDLATIQDCEMVRGTPVYVEADADLVQVQKMMARCHIRSVPVLRDDRVVGFLDLVELAGREDLF